MPGNNLSLFALAFSKPNSTTNVTCKVHQNSSFPIPGVDIYEGIPTNLVLNVTVWLLLLICFTILRKVAWDYGRIALLSPNDEQTRKRLLEQSTSSRDEEVSTKLQWTDNCLWICSYMRLTNAEIVRRCGRDAYIYILFQRYMIVYVSLISFLSLFTILPVNLTGINFSSDNNFGSLTIANSNAQYLWIHSVMALIYFLMAVVFMQRFSYCLESMKQNRNISNTLMISNIKKPNKEAIIQYLTSRYSKESIVDIQFTYDVNTLTKMDAQRRWITRAKMNSKHECQLNNQTENEALYMYPYRCAWLCSCCFCEACGCHKVNAVQFYTELEEKLRVSIDEEKTRTYKKPLGIVFVTMSNSESAECVYRDFHSKWTVNSESGNSSDPSNDNVIDQKVISTQSWEIQLAPQVDNIIWENLCIFGYKWWLRAIFLNITIFIICFFFTTPVILLEKSERLLQKVISSVFDEFLPTLLLWLFACLLPNVVYYTHQFIGYWTRNSEHHAVMKKTFIFLVLMVIILPSLGLTSVQGVLESKIVEHYQCIFATDNVAFFVNYVVTSAFIGTGLELLRLPELLFYTIRIMFTRSSAERSAVREAEVYNFHFGFQYAWLLCITAVILTYSIPCPLIAPCGLIYLIAKHVVDRYNIYFAYRPLRVDLSLHTSAGNLFVIAAILVPGCVLAFISLRYSETKTLMLQSIFIFAIVSMAVTLLVFVDHIRFGLLKRLTFTLFNKCCTQTVTEIPEDTDARKYVPYVADVLLESNNCTPEPSCASTRQSYGAIVSC